MKVCSSSNERNTEVPILSQGRENRLQLSVIRMKSFLSKKLKKIVNSGNAKIKRPFGLAVVNFYSTFR